MLRLLDHLPSDFLNVSAEELGTCFDGPTLISLPGERSPALFVTIMLHGNEDVGLVAAQRVLRKYESQPLPRRLHLFVGNVAAAKERLRFLPSQLDFNRVWPGSDLPRQAEHALMDEVFQRVTRKELFASIDLHNNTGLNPRYACVCSLDWPQLQLANLFSRTVVYFLRPKGVQTRAFAPVCPAVTCECGRIGVEAGYAHAAEFLDACLHLSEIPRHPVAHADLHLFHTVATVKIPADRSVGFEGESADVVLRADLDRLNFQELPPGVRLAHSERPLIEVWQAISEAGREVTAEYFVQRDGVIALRKAAMPSMLTRDVTVIRQDCVGYLMERYPMAGE